MQADFLVFQENWKMLQKVKNPLLVETANLRFRIGWETTGVLT